MFRFFAVFLCVLCVVFAGCESKKRGPHMIVVGTVVGPETQLMEVAKKVAKKCYGLTVKIVVFSDYNMLNRALSQGLLDANAFQHLPYLSSQISARGYKIESAGRTFLYPMAVYSEHFRFISDLPAGAKIGIPNDPSNEARALLLLEQAGFIKVDKKAGVNATILDVTANPRHFTLIPLDAAELPRALSSLSAVVINTNYAVPAGLSPLKDALFSESKGSLYTNLLVVRSQDAHLKKIQELLFSYQSQAVIKEAGNLFEGAALPAFKPHNCQEDAE